MRAFAARYGVDLAECGALEQFETFGEFFARPLRPGLRPIAPGAGVLVSPVDGVVSQAGLTRGGRLVQAKGIDYRLGVLLREMVDARFYRDLGFDLGEHPVGHLEPGEEAEERRFPAPARPDEHGEGALGHLGRYAPQDICVAEPLA